MTPEIVSLLVGLVQAVPGIIAALTPDARVAVREQLEGARTRLPAPGSTLDATEAAIARHTVSAEHVETLSKLSRARIAMTLDERQALLAVLPLLRAAAVPPVLAVPVGAWTEPSNGED